MVPVPVPPTSSVAETPQPQKLSRQVAIEKLLALSSTPEGGDKLQKESQEFSINLPTAKPQISRQQEWQYSYLQVFSKSPEKVDQIAITTINCKAPWDLSHQKEIRERLLKQVKSVSQILWNQEFELNGEVYFKELGPHLHKPIRVLIRETYPPVKEMRLSRGIYKCDGAGGYGFRYDFFLN